MHIGSRQEAVVRRPRHTSTVRSETWVQRCRSLGIHLNCERAVQSATARLVEAVSWVLSQPANQPASRLSLRMSVPAQAIPSNAQSLGSSDYQPYLFNYNIWELCPPLVISSQRNTMKNKKKKHVLVQNLKEIFPFNQLSYM